MIGVAFGILACVVIAINLLIAAKGEKYNTCTICGTEAEHEITEEYTYWYCPNCGQGYTTYHRH